MARNGDVMRSDRLKQVMQQIDSELRRAQRRLQPLQQVRGRGRPEGRRAASPSWTTDSTRWPRPPARSPRRCRPGASRLATVVRRRETRTAGGAGGDAGGAGAPAPAGSGRKRAPEGPPGSGTAHRPRAARPHRRYAQPLARAFQLMTQALAELRAPVPHEALRLRMVAMHGREDPLLDAARFPRLLRQANDAEVADVRKVGDDEYEMSPHRSALTPAAAPAPPSPAAAAPAPARGGARAPSRRPTPAPGRTVSGSGSGSAADPAARCGPATSR